MPHHNDVSHNMLRDLLASCEQATFGKNGEDVLDESYRKAMKLDPEAFPTDFHPSDYGILEAIRQVLLPSMVVGGEGVGIGRQGFRAELYKLNVSPWSRSCGLAT